jgi:acyl-CoA thioesterase I
MENPAKIIFFGDSITKGFTPKFDKIFRKEYPEIDATIINEGISGETSRDGLLRLNNLIKKRPNIVIIGFGMNDWRKGVDKKEYKKNLLKMLKEFENINARVLFTTVSPSYNFKKKIYNKEVDEYSEVVREIAYEQKVKIVDINALWKRELKKPQKGLRDDLHPNCIGYNIICKNLMWMVPRKNTTILWQYNGREAKCNYRCFYCYYIGLHSPKDQTYYDISRWHNNLKKQFRNQHLIVYLGFGEPSLGKMFPEIIKVFESEKNWELRVISNLSTSELKKSANSKLAKDGRFHIVGSFHPTMTTREHYLEKLIYFRKKGIEIPTVYIAHPMFMKHFVNDIDFFRKHDFLIHVRRLQGYYKNKIYPYSYTKEEKKIFEKYMDNGMLKYMQSGLSHNNKLTYSGVHFFIMDNKGYISYDANYNKKSFGNIHDNSFKPLLLPGYYPGKCEGTDDGIANVIEYGYKELEKNHVFSFAKQGGVYKDKNGEVIYGNEFKDFDNSKIRAEYNLQPENVKDLIFLGFSSFSLIKQKVKTNLINNVKIIISKNPKIKKIVKRIYKNEKD